MVVQMRHHILARAVILARTRVAAVTLSLTRPLERWLFSSAAAASEYAVVQNPLEEFFELERSTEEDKPPPHYDQEGVLTSEKLKCAADWDGEQQG